jgi:hypothetical protein
MQVTTQESGVDSCSNLEVGTQNSSKRALDTLKDIHYTPGANVDSLKHIPMGSGRVASFKHIANESFAASGSQKSLAEPTVRSKDKQSSCMDSQPSSSHSRVHFKIFPANHFQQSPRSTNTPPNHQNIKDKTKSPQNQRKKKITLIGVRELMPKRDCQPGDKFNEQCLSSHANFNISPRPKMQPNTPDDCSMKPSVSTHNLRTSSVQKNFIIKVDRVEKEVESANTRENPFSTSHYLPKPTSHSENPLSGNFTLKTNPSLRQALQGTESLTPLPANINRRSLANLSRLVQQSPERLNLQPNTIQQSPTDYYHNEAYKRLVSKKLGDRKLRILETSLSLINKQEAAHDQPKRTISITRKKSIDSNTPTKPQLPPKTVHITRSKQA